MRPIQFIKFHDNTDVVGVSEGITLNTASTMNIQVVNPNSATFNCSIEGTIDGTEWSNLGLVVNLNDGSVIKTSGISNTDIYQCDLTGLSFIRVRINSTTSPISVVGLFVD